MKGEAKRDRKHELTGHGHVRYDCPWSVEERQFEKKEIVTQLLVGFLVQRDFFTLIATVFLFVTCEVDENE